MGIKHLVYLSTMNHLLFKHSGTMPFFSSSFLTHTAVKLGMCVWSDLLI